MKDWFESLEKRERIVVLVGAGVVAIALIYSFLWQPLSVGHAAAAENVATWQRSLAAIRPLENLQPASSGNRSPASGRQAPLVVVDQTLRARGLDRALKRSQPTTSNGIRVEFENVAFDDVVVWLGELSTQHSMHVTTGSISNTSQSGPGRVNATFTLERAL